MSAPIHPHTQTPLLSTRIKNIKPPLITLSVIYIQMEAIKLHLNSLLFIALSLLLCKTKPKFKA
jgi:hypothetical protein